MTTDQPDPRSFQHWEDAFQYPIPVVRKLEQQLRSHADENREKLRSLVGASYRSLLDTAETIVDMEKRMGQVETKLAKVGQNCGSRRIERTVENGKKMDGQARSRDTERYQLASQLAILHNAPPAMTRLLKKNGSYLLVAKVLVVSRLVHKTLSQSPNKPSNVDQLWERLLSVRRKLLRRINKQLVTATSETTALVESMCAYALATSSTPTDVLQYFHKARTEEIVGDLKKGGTALAEHGVTALKLCIQTCLDTQTIFPRRLADALAKLKAHPLIQDPDLRGLNELNMNIHDRWLGDEVRNYTPWPRHDELQRPEAEKILARWSKAAITVFLKGIKGALQGEDRLKEVAVLRQELIETWILSGSRMAGVKSANVLDDLRDALNEKLESIVRMRSVGLQSVVTEVKNCLDDEQRAEGTAVTLWDTTVTSSDLSNGAQAFKSAVLNAHQGNDQHVNQVSSAFDRWIDSIMEVKSIVKTMKEVRWDSTFADDDDENSDDEFGDSKQVLLSSDDPKLLEETTQDALSEALKVLGSNMASIVTTSVQKEEYASIHRAVLSLRMLRTINDRIPRLKLQDRSPTLPSPFSAETLSLLHSRLAKHTLLCPTQTYEKMLSAGLKQRGNSHILWEGNPPLPVQPSPSAFRFMRDLHSKMTEIGSDVWAPGCVATLKSEAAQQIAEIFAAHIKAMEALTAKVHRRVDAPEETSDDTTKEDAQSEQSATSPSISAEKHHQLLVQFLFDALYVYRFLTAASTQTDGLINAIQSADAQSLDDAALKRVRHNAAEYVKKTYLLFAILT